mmetsp:Transcript_10987/g.19984  ORF Transcript_10987/g.19984 Transcript_10987/m.19984 type:complete len:251 (-) Transcript_10987:2986-3738(-)
MKISIAILCVLSLLSSFVKASEVQLAESWDGKTFKDVGSIDISLEENFFLDIKRQDNWVASWETARKNEGFYFLKARQDDLYHVTSLRAAALHPSLSPQVSLSIDSDGKLRGICLNLTDSEAANSAEAMSSFRILTVKPIIAPSIQIPSSAGIFSDVPYEDVAHTLAEKHQRAAAAAGAGGSSANQAAPSSSSASGQGTNAPRSGASGSLGGPPQEEKTWWQKNWMLVLGGVLFVVNVLSKFADPGQQRR